MISMRSRNGLNVIGMSFMMKSLYRVVDKDVS